MKDIIKKILIEESKKRNLIVPRRLEDRSERYKRIIYKKIQEYIKNGSKGVLGLIGSPIDSLPSNLKTVGRSLDLNGSDVSSLPSDLKIGGDLDICGTLIDSIPSGLKIDGDLYIWGNPISKKYTNKQIRKMIEDNGGYLNGNIYK